MGAYACITCAQCTLLLLLRLLLLLLQVYGADEAFATGTFAGILPVVEVDGRAIGSGKRGPLTQQLQQLYTALVEADVAGGREGAWEDQ